MKHKDVTGSGHAMTVILVVGAFVATIAAWLTHIIACLAAGKWGFLIAGALMFPVAVVHGVGLWFGFFS